MEATVSLSEGLLQAIERDMGKSIREIQEQTLSDRRREVEESHVGKEMEFTNNFPAIGRGNVLRDRTLSHKEVEKRFNEALDSLRNL